jgi:PAS domain S-box-containing protein
VRSANGGADGPSQHRRRPNMEAVVEPPAEEIKRLKRHINDLVSVLALPAIWTGGEPSKIVSTLLDTLLGMLRLDLIYVRLEDSDGRAPIEMVRVIPTWQPTPGTQEIGEILYQWLGSDLQQWPPVVRKPFGERNLSIAPMRLGLQGEIGVIAAGSHRPDFPGEAEKLLLSVAANQGAIGLRQARLTNQLKRAASELDERVSQRTAELAATNEELRKEIAERKLVEQRLLQEERELRRSEGHKTAILDSSLDCVITIDHEGCVTEFNQAAQRTLGYRRDEIVGKVMADVIVPPSLREKHRAGFARHLATGESRVLGRRLEMTALCADGKEIPVELIITRIPQDGPPAFTGYLRDITERKRNEDALRVADTRVARSEERWRSVFENSAVGVALADLNGQFIATNPVYQRMLGYTEAELQSLSFLNITHENYLEANRTLIDELLGGKRKQFQIEKEYRRKDGKFVWVRSNVSIVSGTERTPRFLLALSEDVSERKQAEDKLRRSEAYLTEAQRLSRSGSWASNLRSGELLWSEEMFRILGYDPEKTKPDWSHFLERVHPKDRPLIEHRAATESTDRNWADPGADYRLLLPDGGIKHLHSIAHTVFEGSEAVEVVGTTIDVTQSKEAEEQLRRSGSFLAEGQRLSRTGSFFWRVETGEITWSEELYRIFGFEPGLPVTLEVIGSRVHPDDLSRMPDMILRAHRAASDFEFEHRIQLPDHTVKYIHVIGHGTRDKDGRLEYIGAAQDITQRRVSERALAKAQSELAQVARVTSLGVLTASIAHEVNQPLSGIITNASTCLRMLSADPPNVDGARETARRTIRDGNRASDVITRLRTLYSKKDLAPEPMDLNEAAREVISLSVGELQRNQVILRYELADDLPPVNGDRVQLQQVILNLLRNASDAMSTVNDRPRDLLVRTERDDGDQVRLSVKDAGLGFGPQAADRLFEAFYTTKKDGMGIGLSISRSIIEAHHGRLWATTNEGHGATLSFSIPSKIDTKVQ